MQSSGIKIFRLRYRGSFESCEENENPENILDYFSVVSLLAIYIFKQKRLYIWVGEYVSESLKNYIASVRAIFLKSYPELRILRNITIDAKSETQDFFDSMKTGGITITKEQLTKKIEDQENKLFPIMSEIDDLKTQADKYLLSEEYNQAIEISDKIIQLAQNFDDRSIIIDQEDFISEVKRRNINKQVEQALNEIETSKKELIKSWNQDQYDAILSKIENSLKLIQENEIQGYEENLVNLKNDLIKFKEKNEVFFNKIENLETNLNTNREKSQLYAALKICEKLINISEEHKKSEIKEKYKLVLKEIKSELEEKNKEKLIESEQLINEMKEIKKVIEVNENTLPIIYEYSVSEILENLSKEPNKKLEKLGVLLEKHRVKINKNIKTKVFLFGLSGEIHEFEKDTEIKKINKNNEKLLLYGHSGFSNPFDEIIEEAILIDLVPYNFEITNIKINNKEVEKTPDKQLTKDGIEYKWKLENIQLKENIEINYQLRRRISRTIIYIFNDQIKIINTHNNLNSLQLEGIFEAKMPFNNSYGNQLNGLVIEDIIPSYYISSIKEPKNILPSEQNETEIGNIIKWSIENIEKNVLNFNYRLMELYKYEELKNSIKDLARDGINSLNNGNLLETLQFYEKIINQFKEYKIK